MFAQQVAQAADVPATLESDLAKHAVRGRARPTPSSRGFLEQELAPRGRDKEAVGREQYARDSRYFLGTEIDLDETYAWGWEELHRIETEMLEISATLAGDGATIADAVAVIESDPARRIDGAENFREWMQELADRTLADLADTHFDIPEPSGGSSAGSRRPRTAASTTRRRRRTSAGRAGCGGRSPTASRRSTRGAR